MNGRYLLDTNTISYASSGRSPAALSQISRQPVGNVFISAISYAEVKFGLVRRPAATRLMRSTEALFAEATIVPWTTSTAEIYARLRAGMQQLGKALSPLDMLIAAHAIEVGATLVSNDRAFAHVPGLTVEDWTA